MFVKKIAVLSAAALVITGLASCSTPDSSSQDDDVIESYEVSRVESYETVEELVGASDLIVVADVSEEFTVTELNGFSFTERVVHPSATLKGSEVQSVVVSGIGTPKAEGALVPGATNLLFLSEYEVQPGDSTGKYVVTGVYAGAYEQEATGRFKKLDHDSPELPAELRVEDVTAVLSTE